MSTQTRREIRVEDREWRESLDYVIEHAGSERAEMLLRILRDRARRRGAPAGGYIGLELGTVYSSLGSQVTVVEVLPTILPLADADVVQAYLREARGLFVSVREDTKTEFEETDEGIRAVLPNVAPRRTASQSSSSIHRANG